MNLDHLEIKIRKATPIRYDRPQIVIKGRKAKLILVNGPCAHFDDDVDSSSSMLNHEFLHWIICILTKTKAGNERIL